LDIEDILREASGVRKKDQYVLDTVDVDSAPKTVMEADSKFLFKYIPSWHEGETYTKAFYDNACRLLTTVPGDDLARYLKVIGFKQISLTKPEAAHTIAASIILARKKAQFVNRDKATEMLQCYKQKNTSAFLAIMGDSTDYNTTLLKEILCCMEGSYKALKEAKDKAYEAETCTNAAGDVDKSLNPKFGMSRDSDCGPMQFIRENGTCCEAIPELMIPVFADETKSIAKGHEILKNIFDNKVRYGKESEDEVVFIFNTVAFIQYSAWKQLSADFQQILSMPAVTVKSRFLEHEEAGAHRGSQIVLDALKKIASGLLEKGRLVMGPVKNAIAFVAPGGRTKDETDPVTSKPIKKKYVQALTSDAERLAFWFVSHLTMVFDAANLVRDQIIGHIVHAAEETGDDVFTTGTKLEDLTNPMNWELIRKENHDLISSVVLDGIKDLKSVKNAPGIAEAVTIMTHTIKNAIDSATYQALQIYEFDATAVDKLAKSLKNSINKKLLKSQKYKTMRSDKKGDYATFLTSAG